MLAAAGGGDRAKVNREIIQGLQCPSRVADALTTYAAELEAVLGKRLAGAYIYGSLARRCFHPATSDVDIMVISEVPCSDAQVAQIRLAHQRAAIPVDATFATRSQAALNETPTPIDFVVKAGDTVLRVPEGRGDFVIDRQDVSESGLALVGPCPHAVIDPVPWQTLAEAMDWLFPAILPRFKNPVLMLCRICYAFANRTLCSKVDAGEWAVSEFDPEWRVLVESALRDYAGGIASAGSRDATLRSFEHYCANYIAELRGRM